VLCEVIIVCVARWRWSDSEAKCRQEKEKTRRVGAVTRSLGGVWSNLSVSRCNDVIGMCGEHNDDVSRDFLIIIIIIVYYARRQPNII